MGHGLFPTRKIRGPMDDRECVMAKSCAEVEVGDQRSEVRDQSD
jgi:hypothetical protein